MRWSIISLIWFRELRDQLRDRRTVFMIVLLPVLLYPLLGALLLQFTQGFFNKPSVVGVAGARHLPELTPRSYGLTPSSAQRTGQPDYPPLLLRSGADAWECPDAYFAAPENLARLQFVAVEDVDAAELLRNRKVEAVLIVPPDFLPELQKGGRPALRLECLDGDVFSQLACKRLHQVLDAWKGKVKEVRLLRQGLPSNFDDAVEVRVAEKPKEDGEQAARGVRDLIIRLFPFLVVMWSLVGALYP